MFCSGNLPCDASWTSATRFCGYAGKFVNCGRGGPLGGLCRPRRIAARLFQLCRTNTHEHCCEGVGNEIVGAEEELSESEIDAVCKSERGCIRAGLNDEIEPGAREDQNLRRYQSSKMLFADTAQQLRVAGERRAGMRQHGFQIEKVDRESTKEREVETSVHATVIDFGRKWHGTFLRQIPSTTYLYRHRSSIVRGNRI